MLNIPNKLGVTPKMMYDYIVKYQGKDAAKAFIKAMTKSKTFKATKKAAESAKIAKAAGVGMKGMKGAASIGALGTIGAGAAATAAMAYPMKRLGERIGYGIEERRAGRRLRPTAMPFREVAAQLPGIQAMKRLGGRAGEAIKRFGGREASAASSVSGVDPATGKQKLYPYTLSGDKWEWTGPEEYQNYPGLPYGEWERRKPESELSTQTHAFPEQALQQQDKMNKEIERLYDLEQQGGGWTGSSSKRSQELSKLNQVLGWNISETEPVFQEILDYVKKQQSLDELRAKTLLPSSEKIQSRLQVKEQHPSLKESNFGAWTLPEAFTPSAVSRWNDFTQAPPTPSALPTKIAKTTPSLLPQSGTSPFTASMFRSGGFTRPVEQEKAGPKPISFGEVARQLPSSIPAPRLKDFFSKAYGKIRSIRFKEAK